MDACYRSAKSRAWEPVELFEWRGGETPRIAKSAEIYEGQVVIKREVLPDGRDKLILKDPATGDFIDRVTPAAEANRRDGGRRMPWSSRRFQATVGARDAPIVARGPYRRDERCTDAAGRRVRMMGRPSDARRRAGIVRPRESTRTLAPHPAAGTPA